jgi:hypothetical protein
MQNDGISEQNNQNQIAMVREREARQAESGRQQDFERSQAELVTNALFEAAPDRVLETADAAADAPDSAINTAADDYNVPTLTGQVQNQDVNENIGATIANATKRTRGMLRNAATLSGQDASMRDAIEALGRMGSESQTIGSNRRGSAGVAQMETRVPAARVTKSDSMLGDLLMLGGQAAGGISGNRAGAAGGKGPFDLGSIFNSNRPLNAIPGLGRVTV